MKRLFTYSAYCLIILLFSSCFNESEKLKKQIATLRSQILHYEKEQEGLNKQIQHLNNELEYLRSGFGESAFDMKNQISNLSKANADLKSENNTISKKLAALENQMILIKKAADSNDVRLINKVINNDTFESSDFAWIKSIASVVVKWVVILILCGGLIGMLILIIGMITGDENRVEIFLRVFTLLIGLLVYFGASFIGFSIPDLVFKSLLSSTPFNEWFVNIIAPTISGFAISWFITYKIKSENVFAARLLVFIGVFIFLLFLDIFINAASLGFQMETLKANLFFTIGTGLYLVFRYDPSGYLKKDAYRERGNVNIG